MPLHVHLVLILYVLIVFIASFSNTKHMKGLQPLYFFICVVTDNIFL